MKLAVSIVAPALAAHFAVVVVAYYFPFLLTEGDNCNSRQRERARARERERER